MSSVTSAPVVGPGEVAVGQTGTELAEAEAHAQADLNNVSAPKNGNVGSGNGHSEGVKSCFNCHKAIESGFAFCIYCGATVI